MNKVLDMVDEVLLTLEKLHLVTDNIESKGGKHDTALCIIYDYLTECKNTVEKLWKEMQDDAGIKAA